MALSEVFRDLRDVLGKPKYEDTASGLVVDTRNNFLTRKSVRRLVRETDDHIAAMTDERQRQLALDAASRIFSDLHNISILPKTATKTLSGAAVAVGAGALAGSSLVGLAVGAVMAARVGVEIIRSNQLDKAAESFRRKAGKRA